MQTKVEAIPGPIASALQWQIHSAGFLRSSSKTCNPSSGVWSQSESSCQLEVKSIKLAHKNHLCAWKVITANRVSVCDQATLIVLSCVVLRRMDWQLEKLGSAPGYLNASRFFKDSSERSLSTSWRGWRTSTRSCSFKFPQSSHASRAPVNENGGLSLRMFF